MTSNMELFLRRYSPFEYEDLKRAEKDGGIVGYEVVYTESVAGTPRTYETSEWRSIYGYDGSYMFANVPVTRTGYTLGYKEKRRELADNLDQAIAKTRIYSANSPMYDCHANALLRNGNRISFYVGSSGGGYFRLSDKTNNAWGAVRLFDEQNYARALKCLAKMYSEDASGYRFVESKIPDGSQRIENADKEAVEVALGMAYRICAQTTEDESLYAEYLESAVRLEDTTAMAILGRHLVYDSDDPEDKARGKKLIMSSADSDNDMGLYLYGVMYKHSDDEALDILSRGSCMGLARKFELFCRRLEIDSKDRDAANMLDGIAKEILEHGSDSEKYRLALMYSNGDGVKKNMSRARILMRSAAESGYEKAKDLAETRRYRKRKPIVFKGKKAEASGTGFFMSLLCALFLTAIVVGVSRWVVKNYVYSGDLDALWLLLGVLMVLRLMYIMDETVNSLNRYIVAASLPIMLIVTGLYIHLVPIYLPDFEFSGLLLLAIVPISWAIGYVAISWTNFGYRLYQRWERIDYLNEWR